MNEVLVKDSKKRPLITLREDGGVVFSRYVDMDKETMKKMVDFYDRLLKEGCLVCNDSVEKFLRFDDEETNDVCG